MQGTLCSDSLRITGPGDGPNLSDRLEGKRPAAGTTTSNTTAEAPAKDALVRRKSGSWSSQVAYADKDPREMVKTLRQGTHTFVERFDEILDALDSQLEVCNHSPGPKHFGGQKIQKKLAG